MQTEVSLTTEQNPLCYAHHISASFLPSTSAGKEGERTSGYNYGGTRCMGTLSDGTPIKWPWESNTQAMFPQLMHYKRQTNTSISLSFRCTENKENVVKTEI